MTPEDIERIARQARELFEAFRAQPEEVIEAILRVGGYNVVEYERLMAGVEAKRFELKSISRVHYPGKPAVFAPVIELRPHPPEETCNQCMYRTGDLCAQCGHDRASHRGRGHMDMANGPCIECPTSYLDTETCNAYKNAQPDPTTPCGEQGIGLGEQGIGLYHHNGDCP